MGRLACRGHVIGSVSPPGGGFKQIVAESALKDCRAQGSRGAPYQLFHCALSSEGATAGCRRTLMGCQVWRTCCLP
jgi:hypothetical protein